MIKIIQICEKCSKECFSSDSGSVLEIDYRNKIFRFICPKCGHINIIDFGDIKSALDRKTKLPSIGFSKG
jgi:predicted RNA-binding Zn-ribbon protein involved in translation (DUF1610 family)